MMEIMKNTEKWKDDNENPQRSCRPGMTATTLADFRPLHFQRTRTAACFALLKLQTLQIT